MNMLNALHLIERGVLVIIAGLTVAAVALELWSIIDKRGVTLADLLLLFLYTEIVAMISAFYASRRLQVTFPIFIAMTALARLIVLQGKDMDPSISSTRPARYWCLAWLSSCSPGSILPSPTGWTSANPISPKPIDPRICQSTA